LFKEISEDREQMLPTPPAENPNLSKYIVAAVVLLVVAGLIILVVARYGAVQREAMMMRQSAESQRLQYLGEATKHEEQDSKEDEKAKRAEIDENLVWKLKADDLKDEIIEIITRNPRVARESFGRIISEEGVEETSKYIHVLGNSIVFDLLKDPAHRRSLRDLSEYYQKSSFDFSPEEECKLLTGLKTKVLASELRVLTRNDLEAFEFLSQMDSPQIFTLINDEKSKIQSVVLAQLSSSKRRQVFELFKGESRISLMNELCDNGTITKDYLMNVAKTLARKVAGRGGLDPETARTSDILQELLERVALEEQRTLIKNLEITNPDGARNIKMRLVTSYTLTYIKSGTLLEIILDLEHEDLVLYLAGAPEETAKLIIEQAPSELADALLEELDSVAKVNDVNFRLVELKVLSKLRNMVNAGRVNLLEINEAMFSERRHTISESTQKNVVSSEKGAA
jgi:flagellar motor switch protein FliG